MLKHFQPFIDYKKLIKLQASENEYKITREFPQTKTQTKSKTKTKTKTKHLGRRTSYDQR